MRQLKQLVNTKLQYEHSKNFIHCNNQKGNFVIKAGLSCNLCRISHVTRKNSNNCRITLLLSQDFPERPLIHPVGCFSTMELIRQLANRNMYKDKTIKKQSEIHNNCQCATCNATSWALSLQYAHC